VFRARADSRIASMICRAATVSPGPFFVSRLGRGGVINVTIDAASMVQLQEAGSVRRPIPVGPRPSTFEEANCNSRLRRSICSTSQGIAVASLYHPDGLTTVDVPDFLRRNQGKFFRTGLFNFTEAATWIVSEAILCGARDVRISLDGEWVVVYADVDWLQGTTDKVFLQLENFPEGGPNGTRAEVLLHTFCSRLIIATPLEVAVMKGDSEELPGLPAGDWVRAIAFAI
jgi:hypothetical protein